MKTTIVIESSKGNLYLYDFLKKELIPCHLLLYLCYLLDQKQELDNLLYTKNNNGISVVEMYGEEDIQYYRNRYLHYKEMGYFSEMKKGEFLLYSVKDMKEAISNINNIVFEVTDACNLCCTYCAYGALYNDYDPRWQQKMSFDVVKAVLDYVRPYWESDLNKSSEQVVSIGFYGGEPLLNFDLIEKSVEYSKTLNVPTRKFQYTMTTNATLIDRHIAFLVENNFQITISLDGSERNHSYRTFNNGKNSFNKVIANIKLIQREYPEFFESNVSFNSVLHNRNSVEEIQQFIYNEFGKNAEIHPVNNSGIRSDKQDEFKKIFTTYHITDADKRRRLMIQRFTSDPTVFNLCQFLLWYSNNQFFDYESFLYKVKSQNCAKTSTGTCFPFSRKIYVTVNNKILACERINQKYVLGSYNDHSLNMDMEFIANKYNEYYKSMYGQCKDCYMINGCGQCIFQLDNLDNNPTCYGHKSEKQMCDYLKQYVDLLEAGDIPFEKLLNEVFLS